MVTVETILFTLHILDNNWINYLTKFGTSEFVESRGPGKQLNLYLGTLQYNYTNEQTL